MNEIAATMQGGLGALLATCAAVYLIVSSGFLLLAGVAGQRA